MNTQKLDNWKELLLDTGKRNNLINLRESKLGQVEIIYPAYNIIFDKINNGRTLEIFDPKKDLDEDIIISNDDTEVTKDNYISRSKYLEMYQPLLKKQLQVLAYANSGNSIASVKNIMKKGLSTIEETGVNVLYMAIGLLEWFEEDPKEIIKSPILLKPITITNKSLNDPYVINELEDDVILNPTLSFKLLNDYKITLPTLNDDELLDDYFKRVEECIVNLKWNVLKEIRISTFSFQKINMYNDVKTNKDIICSNDIVKTLLKENDVSIASGEETLNKDTKESIMTLHSVVDADSSQITAIEYAKTGKSFVLQGPPGTGKSQTITNIIAEKLNDGKTVLFVSEKLAALNVVYNKLKENKLSDFCLELHSHKANKKDVINELNRTLNLSQTEVNIACKDILQNKLDEMNSLNDYDSELYKVQDVINMSFHDIISNLSRVKTGIDHSIVIPNIETKNQEYLDNCLKLLNKYQDITKYIGTNYKTNTWYGLINYEPNYENDINFKNELNKAINAVNNIITINDYLKDTYNISALNLEYTPKFSEFLSFLSNSQYLSKDINNLTNLNYVYSNLEEYYKNLVIIYDTRSYLNKLYKDNIYKVDYEKYDYLLNVKYKSFIRRLFSRTYKDIKNEVTYYLNSPIKLKYNDVKKTINNVLEYHKAYKVYEKHLDKYMLVTNDNYQGLESNIEVLREEITKFYNYYNDYYFGDINNLSEEVFSYKKIEFSGFTNTINEKLEEINNNSNFFNYFSNSIIDFKTLDLKQLLDKFNSYLDDFDKIENWKSFIDLYGLLDSNGLIDYINKTITYNYPIEKIDNLYQEVYYKEWADFILRNNKILNDMKRPIHDNLVKEFIKNDETHFDISKYVIRQKVSSKRPSLDMVATGSSVSILRREASKTRKQKPIRDLLNDIKSLAQTLKPCFLMSPLSVSTYLNPNFTFDVVIFDEASQIFPQDALGAIYRGKQLIVVGDSKQMPPSNFFNNSVELETDDFDDDVSNFESILDLCNTSFNQISLKWHYRSKAEQLIAFSNKNFYDNILISFPSTVQKESDKGVEYYHVDGIFDRKDRRNNIEAKEVVKLIIEHFDKHPTRSLGVVAFSISQQDEIERELTKFRKQNQAYEEFLASKEHEPFFIKNLETVQGDERDTIIFSVGYGPDEDGKVLNNFGPINKTGGERRLNVAFTRAKINVKLVTSMHHTDIDPNRTSSLGALLLKQYLDYAENGDVALLNNKVNEKDKYQDEYFEEEVANFLKEKGYTLERNLGCSKLKIDIALKNNTNDHFVLAIECDGKSYHNAKNARDRDRLRQEILERAGWNYYRIWSTDWFRNTEVEKGKLLIACENALNKQSEDIQIVKEEDNQVNIESFELVKEVKNDQFDKYNYTDIDDQTNKLKFARNFSYSFIQLLKDEQPLSREWILRRFTKYFGRTKFTSVVQESFDAEVSKIKDFTITLQDGFYYYGKPIEKFRISEPNNLRKIEDISNEEICLAFKEIIKANFSVQKDNLYNAFLKLVGISRLTESEKNRLDKALLTMKKDIAIEENQIKLK